MRKLSILGLILAFACTGEDTQLDKQCYPVTFSDASPIQFWPIDCATWNESRPAGVHHYCFCQPWQCDDEIKIPIDLAAGSYVLKILDEDDQEIDQIEFTGADETVSMTPSDYGVCDRMIRFDISEFGSNPIELTPLSSWTNFNTGGAAWTTGSSTPFVNIAGLDITDEISTVATAVGSGSGIYSFDYDLSATVLSDGMYIFVKCYIGGSTVGSTTEFIISTSQSGTILVTCSGEPDRVTAKIFHGGPGGSVVTINSFEPTPITFNTLYKSDCLDVKISHSESVLIEYTNHSNYAGISYGDETPDPSFNLRIPAVFFESRFPQEGEDFQTSSNEVISLNSQIKEQRLLSTDRMPKYMHRKILLALSHQFVFIEGEYWIKGGENYEKKEKSNKRDSFDMYTCWLTRQDYVVRNIL
jgi:hypothetical protein